MKKMLFLLVASLCMTLVADVSVTAVEAHQRYPWNGLVDITVTLQGPADEIGDAEWSFAATNSATKVSLPVVHITQNGADSGSGTSWMRKFVWDTNADLGEVKIDDVALTVDVELPYVQLWENGPYWAKCNIGATKPEEYGYYFWWGDTVGYKRNAANDGWVSVKKGSSFAFYSVKCLTDGKSNSQLQLSGYTDSTGNLVAAHDAVTAHLGAPWRMPTAAEFNALISNCTSTWTTRNGIYGRLVSGKGMYSSRSIFLPAAGYGFGETLRDVGSRGSYCSSSPYSDTTDRAWGFFFKSGDFTCDYYSRSLGCTVRPLRGFAH